MRLQIRERVTGFDPIRHVAMFSQLQEMNHLNVSCDGRRERSLFFRVLPSGVVVVSKDDDVPARNIAFATIGQTVTSAAKCKGQPAEPGDCLDILFALRPVYGLGLRIEWIGASDKVRNVLEAFRPSVLPACRTVCFVEDLVRAQGVAVLHHDLDVNRHTALTVDMPAFFVAPRPGASVPSDNKLGLAFLVRWCVWRECLRRDAGLGRSRGAGGWPIC